MYILFEEHQYESRLVAKVLKDIYVLQDVDKKVSIQYVGYFYNPHLNDCIFILPKVLLQDEKDINGNKIEVLSGIKNENGDSITPEQIISPKGQDLLNKKYRSFIYNFSVWIYRALCVFYHSNPSSKAVLYKHLPQAGKGRRHKAETYLDIILSLIKYNRENSDFILFTIKNLHRGNNKINWGRTINHSQSFVLNNDVIYLDPVNKKRVINYEDELFVIFFSILNYLNDRYGFNTPINIQYELIQGKQFQQYIHGFGKTRLLQIKYKYFSDKALQLWDLCYAFFDNSYRIAINTNAQEYILAKSFNVIFEAMIDELIGDHDIPNGLKDQLDGKRIDHLYIYDGLMTSNDQKDQIYYIGDSKYYKNKNKLGTESVYKQFTYARNVIQWNIDLFVNGKKDNWLSIEEFDEDKAKYKDIKLRDDQVDPLTEGYNVIPNFFISAFVNEDRRYDKGDNIIIRTEQIDGKEVPKTYISTQFNNRLFDRDTLILSHYDVNFLYILYLYARNKKNEKAAWKRTVRRKFRNEIRRILFSKYDFFALKSKGNPLAGEEFIREHFKELQGKLYRPYEDKNIYSLALEKQEGKKTEDSDEYNLLEEFFVIEKFEKIEDLDNNPQEKLDQKVQSFRTMHPYSPTPEKMLPDYHIEAYKDNYFVIGLYHDEEHWNWITGQNDKKTLIYNVRLDKKRKGVTPQSVIRQMKPRFAILYEEGHESENNYHVFRIHDYAVMTEERMRKAQYPREPEGDYFIFRFDEEISIGKIDINKYITMRRLEKGYVDGMPLYPTGHDLIKYRV